MQAGAVETLAGSGEIVVTRTDDPVPDGCAIEDCSLREAVIEANQVPGSDLVSLAAGTYVLEIARANSNEEDPTKGDIDITDDLTITGAGMGDASASAGVTIIDADGVDRAFEVTASAEVTISGVRIRNGETPVGGGGIRNSGGSLTVMNSVIEDNMAAAGGGIMNAVEGSLSLDSVHVVRNEATSNNGGGLVSAEPNSVAIVSSTIADNIAGGVGLGGGIYTVGVDLQDSTVSGNMAGFDGGGIASVQSGTVIIANATIDSNTTQSGDGAGIFMSVGNLDLSDSVVSGNQAGDAGGGIYIAQAGSSTLIRGTQIINNSGGPMTGADGGGINVSGTIVIEDSSVSGNMTANDGGGIVTSGPLTIFNSIISDNEAGDDGGGIDFDDGMIQNPQSLIRDSTISNNIADSDAGGIDNDGHLTIINSTISDNTAQEGGGGIENDETVNLVNTTISGNTASTVGGGIWVREPGDTVSLHHATISNNAIGIGGVTPAGATEGAGVHIDSGSVQYSNTIFAENAGGGNCGGSLANFQSNGQNLEDEDACPNGSGDINNTDPLLEPLADNGGPTMTHALPEESPAVDAAVDNCPLPETDQRGIERPQGDACDIGAFEYQFAAPGIPQLWGDSDCSGTVAATDALKTLQELAALPYDQTPPCFPLGEPIIASPAGFGQQTWGDVDCNDALAATDALALLRHIAALPVNQEPDCPELEADVLISGQLMPAG